MFIGVDSHKDTLAACRVGSNGQQVDEGTFRNTEVGHAETARVGPPGRAAGPGGH